MMKYVLLADWTRVSRSTGYPVVYCSEHPASWSTGYVYVHRLIAEAKIGRMLLAGEVVHHLDHVKDNFDPDNLEVVGSHQAHGKLHRLDRPKTLVAVDCGTCGKRFVREKRQSAASKGYRADYCSRRCSGVANGYKKRIRARNLEDQVSVS